MKKQLLKNLFTSLSDRPALYSDCGTLAYDRHIGPFSNDTDLGAIGVSYNCNQTSPDTTQYIKLTLNGNNYSWAYSTITESKTGSSSTIAIIGGSPNNTSDSSTYFLGGLYNDTTASGPGNYPINVYTIINGNVAYNTSYPIIILSPLLQKLMQSADILKAAFPVGSKAFL